MKKLVEERPDVKKSRFRNFLLQRNPSVKFADKYLLYLDSSLVKKYLKDLAGTENIYSIKSIELLQAIYEVLKNDDNNKRLHNVYSGVVSAFIKFLTHKELRRPIWKRADCYD